MPSSSDARVGVVITSFNHGVYLPQALDGVLAQALVPVDVIVVDDGSADNTQDVVSRYHVRYIRTDHRGAAAARNTGWQHVEGDTIAFLDADDWWLPDKLRLQVAALAAYPEAGLVYADALRVTIAGSPIDRWSRHFPPVHGKALEPMLLKNRVQTSTVLMPRVVLQHTRGFNEEMPAWEDIDLWVRVAMSWPFAYVPEVVACYRMGPGLSSRHGLMASGELATAVRVRTHLASQGCRLAACERAVSRAYAHMGISCYLDGAMPEARRWIRSSWQLDRLGLVRDRSLFTYTKSLAGAHIVRRLRRWRRRAHDAVTVDSGGL
jgi:glycosyltransferase involved in cell wall biosynthesis